MQENKRDEATLEGIRKRLKKGHAQEIVASEVRYVSGFPLQVWWTGRPKNVNIKTFNYESRRYNWPYCIQRMDDSRWVMLNRDYKPLNLWLDPQKSYDTWVVYEDFARELPRLTSSVRKKLDWTGRDRSEDRHSVMLYNDGCKPDKPGKDRTAYVERLKLLCEVLGDERDWRVVFNGLPRVYRFRVRKGAWGSGETIEIDHRVSKSHYDDLLPLALEKLGMTEADFEAMVANSTLKAAYHAPQNA